jgi:hypothetical protein
MAEIYINTNSPITHRVFWQGEIVAADAAPTVKVYDVTSDITITPAILPTTLLTTLTSTAAETDPGSYYINLPLSLTQRQRKFKLLWEYTVNSSAASHTAYVDVVTPYVNIYEAMDELNLGVEPSDPNYKTYTEITRAERYARKQIEDYTGQDFFTYDDVEVVFGNDSDILPLPYRIVNVHKLYHNDILLVDTVSTPTVNNWTYTPIISETNFGIRVDRTGLLDNTVYIANGLVPPSINDTYSGMAFAKNVRYRVEGRYGWESVPGNVQLACIELMKDYFAKDTVWRTKYVKNIQTFDWQFEYSGDAYSGTGNQLADKLLGAYVLTQMVVV